MTRPPSTTHRVALRLRSAVPFRLRWEADVLRKHPRLAAAVQQVLASQRGITAAEVNPRTGRILVRHDASLTPGDVERLVRLALATEPLTAVQYRTWNERTANNGAACKVDHYHGDACGHDHGHDHADEVRGAVRSDSAGGPFASSSRTMRSPWGSIPAGFSSVPWESSIRSSQRRCTI